MSQLLVKHIAESVHCIWGLVSDIKNVVKLKNVWLVFHLLICVLHECMAAKLLFMHRGFFWNIDVLITIFDSPLIISFIECFFTAVVCGILLIFSNFSLIHCISNGFSKTMHDQSVNFPLTFIFALLVGFNNICLYYMDIPMYFICRSLTIPLSIIFSYRTERLLKKWRLFLPPSLIIIGYIISMIDQSSGTLLISVGGIFGFFSSIFITLFLSEMKQAQNTSILTQIKQVYVNNVVACVLFLPAIMFIEISEFNRFPSISTMKAIPFNPAILTACIFSFLIGQLKFRTLVSCPTQVRELFTLIRSVLQTLIAIQYFQIDTTAIWRVGLYFIAIGSAIHWLAYRTTSDITSGTNREEEKNCLSVA